MVDLTIKFRTEMIQSQSAREFLVAETGNQHCLLTVPFSTECTERTIQKATTLPESVYRGYEDQSLEPEDERIAQRETYTRHPPRILVYQEHLTGGKQEDAKQIQIRFRSLCPFGMQEDGFNAHSLRGFAAMYLNAVYFWPRDADGELLIPPGAVKSGILDSDGLWIEWNELEAVDDEGKELPIVASSFGQTIELSEKVSDEVFLDHVWKSVYQLDNAELAAAVGKDIYAFVFNYRADASPEDGYLVASEGKVFPSDGEKISSECVGIAEKSTLDDSAEEVPVEDDELGFSMM